MFEALFYNKTAREWRRMAALNKNGAIE